MRAGKPWLSIAAKEGGVNSALPGDIHAVFSFAAVGVRPRLALAEASARLV
jgi:hypothetical protein